MKQSRGVRATGRKEREEEKKEEEEMISRGASGRVVTIISNVRPSASLEITCIERQLAISGWPVNGKANVDPPI